MSNYIYFSASSKIRTYMPSGRQILNLLGLSNFPIEALNILWTQRDLNSRPPDYESDAANQLSYESIK